MQDFNSEDGGVYEIYNLVTDKRYIGATRRFFKRYLGHRRDLYKNNHVNPGLQADSILYGIEHLEFRVRIRLIDTSRKNLDLHEALEQREFDEDMLYNVNINSIQVDAELMPKVHIPSIDEIKRRIFGEPD